MASRSNVTGAPEAAPATPASDPASDELCAFCANEQEAFLRRQRTRCRALIAAAHVLLAALVALVLLPGAKSVPGPAPLLGGIAVMELLYLAALKRGQSKPTCS